MEGGDGEGGAVRAVDDVGDGGGDGEDEDEDGDDDGEE